MLQFAQWVQALTYNKCGAIGLQLRTLWVAVIDGFHFTHQECFAFLQTTEAPIYGVCTLTC